MSEREFVFGTMRNGELSRFSDRTLAAGLAASQRVVAVDVDQKAEQQPAGYLTVTIKADTLNQILGTLEQIKQGEWTGDRASKEAANTLAVIADDPEYRKP